MGKGWAVAGAVGLGLVVAQAALAGLPGDVAPLTLLRLVALVASFAAWAYALSVASYGSKGALAALVAFGLGESAFAAMALRAWGFDVARVLAWANLAFGLVVAGAAFTEIRARRGPVQWGTALFFALPLALWLALELAARSL